MTFRVYPTNIVSERFANDIVFSGNLSYSQVLSSNHSGIRAPNRDEYRKIFEALDRSYTSGFWSDRDFAARDYTIHVYMYERGVGDDFAHNSSANAQKAGAPNNSIWIGFDATDLARTKNLSVVE